MLERLSRELSSSGVTRSHLALAAVVLLVTVAGCSHVGGDSSVPDPIENVPADANMAIHMESSVLQNPDNLQLMDLLGQIMGEDGAQGLFDRFGAGGLDMTQVSNATVFAKLPDNLIDEPQMTGIVFQADWSKQEVASNLESASGGSYQSSQYAGATLYSPSGDGVYLGILGDGEYVVGSESAVKGALEVANGDADPVGGEIRSAFADAQEGSAVAVLDPPRSLLPGDLEQTLQDEGLGNTGQFREVEVVRAVYYTTDSGKGVNVTISMPNERKAETMKNTLALVPLVLKQQAEKQAVKDELDKVSVSQSGSDVIISYQSDQEGFTTLLEAARTAACQLFEDATCPEPAKATAVDQVPANANGFVEVDTSYYSDDQFRTVFSEFTATINDTTPINTSPMDLLQLDEFESQSGLDLAEVNQTVLYAKFPPYVLSDNAPPIGIIYHANWTTEETVSGMESFTGSTLTATSYKGTQNVLYEPIEGTRTVHVGVLGDGEYVVGNETAVKDALETAYGDQRSIGGDALMARQQTRDAPIRSVLVPPEAGFPIPPNELPLDLSVVNYTIAITQTYEQSGEDVTVRYNWLMTNESTAKEMELTIENVANKFTDALISDPDVRRELKDPVSFDRNGKTVSVIYDSDVDGLLMLIEELPAELQNAGL